MRGASPVDHLKGGTHISGGECITSLDMLETEVSNLIKRALNHPKGNSDFINISIQKIHENSKINYIKPLKISTFNSSYIPKIFKKLGFNEEKISLTIDTLLSLKNLKGALLVSFDNFEKFEENIVRCTNMDYSLKIKPYLNKFLEENCFYGKYLKDALCLSSKVCNHENIICEVCISDDKNYTTGYIGSKKFGYVRIENFKPKNHDYGGRIIFIKDKDKLQETIDYLKNEIVIINSLPEFNKDLVF